MSVIHSSWALLGWRSSLRAGTARCSTVRSIAYSRQASASTASPIHSRRPARVASCGTCWSALSMGSPHRRRRQETSVPERPDSGGRRVPGTVAWPGARRRGPWLVGRLGLTGLVDVHVHFLLDAVWGRLAEAGVPVVVHCGSGPVPGRHTGPGPFGEVLRRHPTLTAVIAHLGMPEYAEHLALAERYPNVHLDTTMACTPFTEALMPMPPELRPRLAGLRDRIVLGSDFPNIPHPYAVQLESLERLDLGDDWLRAVCWDNGVRLLGRRPVAGAR